MADKSRSQIFFNKAAQRKAVKEGLKRGFRNPLVTKQNLINELKEKQKSMKREQHGQGEIESNKLLNTKETVEL